MNLTRDQIVQKILDYLNGQLRLTDLVHWSEDALFQLSETNADVPDARAMMRVLGYLGAGDSADFPLTWEVLTEFLEGWGVRVRVVAEAV